ncbi:cyclin-D4-1-like [Camellia sinensis]|uniref:cyclin-D4-1-like n=1 Tax=Camellia sinensis TaxID=4442 RepID=UPI0010365B8E|nr:cyclin-D4-1-like [Camellia sinensis]
MAAAAMTHSPDHSASNFYAGGDVSDADIRISDLQPSDHFPPLDESLIKRLIDSEHDHMPQPDYLRRCRDRSIDLTTRQDSIHWILRVHAHYHFRPVTAFLSVNYLDRFLSSRSLPKAKGWPFQLLAVACLSLAAKIQEPSVPLILDLQVLEPKFIFDPKTVQRMELYVMSNLHWRLLSVTPFDFLDYFISKLPSSASNSNFLGPILSSSSEIILNTIRVVDFLGFPPSAIAAAAVLTAVGESVDLPEGVFYERANKEMVRSCHQLMEEYLVDMCPSAGFKRQTAEPPSPSSPVGVLDAAACASCDTHSDNRVSLSGSGSSQAEPPNKRLRSSASDVQ